MRLDHLLSKDKVGGLCVIRSLIQGKQLSLKVGQYIHKIFEKIVHSCLVLMRLGETPVPIPNTTVKT